MSGNTMLAPREDSDAAIDRDARGGAGGGVDRYRTWVTDHGQCHTVGGRRATHLATVSVTGCPASTPATGLEPDQRAIYTPKATPDLQFLSVALPLRRRDCLPVVFVVAVYPLLRWRSTAFR